MKEKNEPRLFYIGGITGSGKTTVSTEASLNIANTSVIHGSKLLMDHFGFQSYEELNSVSDEVQRQGRLEIFSNLNRTKANNVLVDGHYVIFIRDGNLSPTVDFEWISKFTDLVHVVAQSSVILERLLIDVNDFPRRIRNLIGADATIFKRIKMSQDASTDYAQKLANNLNLPFHILDNSSSLEETVAKLKELIEPSKT